MFCHHAICARCKYLYIDKLAPCTSAKTLSFRIVVYFEISCNFEPKSYVDISAHFDDKNRSFTSVTKSLPMWYDLMIKC